MGFNKVVTIQSTQTVFDLALQLEGDADREFTVIAENPSIENLNSDATGIEATYDINNTYAQRYYISKSIEVSNKPENYLNKVDGFLLCENENRLVQENGYRILY
jgi:hypothetical protein